MGKGSVKLFFDAPACHFEDGEKEVSSTFVAKNPDDKLECVFNLKIFAALPNIYNILITAEVTNNEGEVSNDRVAAKIDCLKNNQTEPLKSKAIS